MELARIIGLPEAQQQHLFYALLLKDAGCSANAERMFQVFGGDDQAAKRGAWERDWRTLRGKASYALKFAEPGGTLGARIRSFLSLARGGREVGRSIYRSVAIVARRSRRAWDFRRRPPRPSGRWTSTGTAAATRKA